MKSSVKNKKELVGFYTCFVRPILDYCSNVYHPMLTKTLTQDLENLQYTALKIVYGYEETKPSLLELSGLTTLEERRRSTFRKFCLKVHASDRFREKWIEKREFEGPELRKQNIIKEHFAHSKRLFDSPLFTLRRTLNDILIT